ncbi:thaumatin-like protein 1a [Phtheirospermum japonicum]|uniref:Thaumatin-like protein 1a n=1 Tax=Phtheirospermum japonicum TaxID=374723 RepID=A0A830DM92_9LAMI|nr:thaumatin-like protein 1a [Phtheirospermum japonicum]
MVRSWRVKARVWLLVRLSIVVRESTTVRSCASRVITRRFSRKLARRRIATLTMTPPALLRARGLIIRSYSADLSQI